MRPTPTPTPTPEPYIPPPPEPRVRWIDLALAILGMMVAGGVVLVAGRRAGVKNRAATLVDRLPLWSWVCGLVGYLFYGLEMPGSGILEGVTPGLRGLLIGLGCGLLPLVAVVWLRLQKRGSGQ